MEDPPGIARLVEQQRGQASNGFKQSSIVIPVFAFSFLRLRSLSFGDAVRWDDLVALRGLPRALLGEGEGRAASSALETAAELEEGNLWKLTSKGSPDECDAGGSGPNLSLAARLNDGL